MKRGRPSHVILYFRKPAHLIKDVVNLSEQEINQFKNEAKHEIVPYEFIGTKNCTAKLDNKRFAQQVIPISERVDPGEKGWKKFASDLQHDHNALYYKLEYNG
jgi:hypothetical protein